MINLIIDGDFGGDEMQLMAVAIAHPDKFHILGLTTVFGNAPQSQVTKNAMALSEFLCVPHLPIYAGHSEPINSEMREGDNAHGSNGMGGVEIESSTSNLQNQHAVDFIIETLLNSPDNTITITATGPQTNIAAAIRKNPDAMARVKNIVIMGGATETMSAKDMTFRKGNITPKAEFNFYQDATAANEVLKSGLPIIVLPMNCTHHLTLIPSFETELYNAIHKINPDKAKEVIDVMAAPRELDIKKFGIFPVMHDVNTVLYLIYPDAYPVEESSIEVTSEGECIIANDDRKSVTVALGINDTRLLHNQVMQSFVRVLSQRVP